MNQFYDRVCENYENAWKKIKQVAIINGRCFHYQETYLVSDVLIQLYQINRFETKKNQIDRCQFLVYKSQD